MQLRWTDGGSPPQRARCPGCFSEKDLTAVCRHCGFDEAQDNPVGTLPSLTPLHQGRYKIGRVLGRPDWFGVAYLGLDEERHRRVAIREYFPSDRAALRRRAAAASPPEGQEDAFLKGLEVFCRQAEFLAGFDHPHIQKVGQCFCEDGLAYRVTDFPGGIRLERYLKQSGRGLSPQQAAAILAPVLEGLHRIHQAGHVHGGLQLGSIRLIRQGDESLRPLLIGFAAERSAYAQIGHEAREADACQAPEVAEGRPADPLSEVYSASAILYRMIAGELPPNASGRRSQPDPLLPLSRLAPGASAALEDVVMRGLALERSARPQSLQELLDVLRQCAEPKPSGVRPADIPLPAPLQQSPPARPAAEVVSFPPSAKPPAPGRKGRTSAAWLAAGLVGIVALLALLLSLGLPMWSGADRPQRPLLPEAQQQQVNRSLAEAVRQDSPRDVQGWIEKGADPDARDPEGTPLLIVAIGRGEPEIARLLIDAGAEVNARGPHGHSALRAAVLMDSADLVRLLADRGADDRDEALKLARELGRPEIIRILQN